MLEVKGLGARYGGHEVLVDASFTLAAGQVLCLLGRNGSGKSTLMKALLGTVENTGDVRFAGKPIKAMSQRQRAGVFAYIPQKPGVGFEYTAYEVVLMGRTAHLGLMGQPGKKDEEMAMQALEQVGAGHLAHRSVQALSGGEAKLVFIARALCQQAVFILMDEPTAELDYPNQLMVLDAIRGLKEKGVGVIVATHAIELAYEVADQVLLLRQGACVSYGVPGEALRPPKLEKAFGVPMETVIVHDRFGRKKQLCFALAPPRGGEGP